jgi:GPH family glycoside/pentoside/hexuronide:cation symporter
MINGIYFFCVTTGFYTSLSLVGIPYDSSLPEMAKTIPQRVSLSMWKNILGTVGVLVGVAIAPSLLSYGNAIIMGLSVGLIAWICIYITLTALTENAPQQPQDLKLSHSLLSLCQNQPFLLLGLSTVIVQTAYAMLLTNLPYFVTLIIGRSESQVSWFQGIVVVTMIFTAPLWNWLVRYYSQRRLLMVAMLGLVVMAMVNFTVGLFPGVSPSIMALISLALLAPFLGGYFILVYAMMGDVVDYDELLTGKRREALYYGIFSLSAGLGVALATFIVPFLFDLYGYTAANPWGVRMVFLVGAGLVFLGAVAFRGYRLSDTVKERRLKEKV